MRTAPPGSARPSSGTWARRDFSTQRSAGRAELEHLCDAPQLSIVPFRHVPDGVADADLDEHNARLVEALQRQGDVWVAPARVDGKVCLRPCVVNYRTTDDDVRAFVEATCLVGASLTA